MKFYLISFLCIYATGIWAEEPSSCFTKEDNRSMSFHTVMRGANTPVDEKTLKMDDNSTAYYGNAFYAHNDDFVAPRPVIRDENNTAYRTYKGFWANYCTPLGKPGTDCERKVVLEKGNYLAPALVTSFAEDPSKAEVKNQQYQVRPVFKSYLNANTCTLAQIASMLGSSDEEVNQIIVSGDGLTAIYRNPKDASSEEALIRMAKVHVFSPTKQALFLQDICLLERDPKLDPYGIVLDYEVWDRRSPTVTLNFVEQVANLVHSKNKKFMLYTNSLQQMHTRVSNGITEENANQVLHLVDSFSSVVWSGATKGAYMLPSRLRRWSFLDSLQANIDILRGSHFLPLELIKMVPTISLYGLSPKEAKQIHDELVNLKFDGIKIWNNGAKIEKDCSKPVNHVLRCLVTGQGNCSSEDPLME